MSESCGEDNIKNINIYLNKSPQIMTCIVTYYTGIYRSELQQTQRPKCSHEERKCVPGRKREGHFWQEQENEVGLSDYLIY